VSFLNIQIGGSCFPSAETRTKNFTATVDHPVGGGGPRARDWAAAHERMYQAALNMLESFRDETRALDAEKVADDLADAGYERESRDRGDRPEPSVTEPAEKGATSGGQN
jgi:hypothetical protein